MPLEKIVLSSRDGTAEIFPQGAHITSWRPRGQMPVLFLSAHSLFEPGNAIRGGVPVIFPWFGPPPNGRLGPSHGLARTREWYVESRDDTVATLTLRVDEAELRFRVEVAASLNITLEVRNGSPEPMIFEEALHTYFEVGNVRTIAIGGLEGTTFIDKADGMQRRLQAAGPLGISGETDRVYLDTNATCVIDDPVLNRRISICKSGAQSTVVWNPWIAKSAAMADFGADEWQRMVCIESGNLADNAVTLAPGASHRMSVSIHL